MRFWGIDTNDSPKRIMEIVSAIRKLNLPKDFSVVDIACGYGSVLIGISKDFPESRLLGIDINSYWEWDGHPDKFRKQSVQEFIKIDQEYDVVMMLNSYRNWDGQEKVLFDYWLKKNVRYFITSTEKTKELDYPNESIGQDSCGFELKLYTIK